MQFVWGVHVMKVYVHVVFVSVLSVIAQYMKFHPAPAVGGGGPASWVCAGSAMCSVSWFVGAVGGVRELHLVIQWSWCVQCCWSDSSVVLLSGVGPVSAVGGAVQLVW